MTGTYLLDVIKALNPAERQEMALFLTSTHFNGGGNTNELIKLYKIILDAAPEFSDDLLSKERVYFKIFSERSMVSGKLEKLMTDLNKHLRNYALIERYLSENNEVDQQINWATWLRERGLAERARQLMTKLKTQEQREKAESLERHKLNFLFAEEQHLWELNHNQAKGDLNIPNLVYRLDLFYHIYRTELANRYLLQQKATLLPEGDFSETKADDYQSESILLEISRKIFKVLQKGLPTAEEAYDLMQLLRSNDGSLSSQTLDHFYAYLRNFCTLLINNGNIAFIPVLHQINKDNLEDGYFFAFGKLPPHAYLNLVQVAIRAKEYDWAKKFSEAYKALIVGNDDDHFFYRINMAQCYFAEGNFDRALDSLPDAPSNSHNHHRMRRLELRIYYELNSDLLLFKLDAFRKFIERTAPKTLPANIREMDLNFLNILLQLAQSPPKDKARSERLIKRIEEKKLLAERDWLLEKARELG